jgi:diguanylate cyclase (GGDEF)-like protein
VTVLVLEPDVPARAVIARALYLRGHDVAAFDDAAVALGEWQIDQYPLVLVGWKPGGAALDFCRRLRASPAGRDAVIVLIGADLDPEEIDALAAWADDVVPLDPDQLATRLAVAERRVADAAQRREVQQQLAHQALHDVLTDLPNRALLTDRLDHSLRASLRQRSPLALMTVDLDRFKQVNDTYGHHVGDVTLQELAGRMRAVLRASDTVARMGGDEFSVLLPSIGDTENAVQIARKVVQAICEPCVVDGHTVTVGASVGVALFPLHGTDVDALLLAADTAMYAAKRAGGGVALYPSDALDTPIVLADSRPAASPSASRPAAQAAGQPAAGIFGFYDRRSQAELLRTIGQDLDRFGAHPRTIICETNGYRVRENGGSDAERWFPIEELIRESVSRALRRQPH